MKACKACASTKKRAGWRACTNRSSKPAGESKAWRVLFSLTGSRDVNSHTKLLRRRRTRKLEAASSWAIPLAP